MMLATGHRAGLADWPGRSPLIGRAWLPWAEQGMEREGFYASMAPCAAWSRPKKKKTSK